MELPSPELRIFFERAASRYQSDLALDTSVQEYLSRRGFTAAVASTFRLGVVRRPIEGQERFRGRLAVPYLTRAGVVNMVFRCLQPHICKTVECPKYLPAFEGMEKNLYNVSDTFKDEDFIAVCEGELDTIALSASGIPAVGISGATSWKDHWRRVVEDFATVYAVGDGDEAGAKFNSMLMKKVKAIPIKMRPGEDCNSEYARGGAEALRSLFPDRRDGGAAGGSLAGARA